MSKLPPKHITVNSEVLTRVKGFTQYYISESGDVWDSGYSYFLKRYTVRATGYQFYYLWKYGHQYCKYVHELVAVAYVPNPEGFEEIGHKDDIKSNNHYTNLEWTTHRDNVIKRFTK